MSSISLPRTSAMRCRTTSLTWTSLSREPDDIVLSHDLAYLAPVLRIGCCARPSGRRRSQTWLVAPRRDRQVVEVEPRLTTAPASRSVKFTVVHQVPSRGPWGNQGVDPCHGAAAGSSVDGRAGTSTGASHP